MSLDNKYLQVTGILVFLALQNAQAAKEINLRHQPFSLLSNYTLPTMSADKKSNPYDDIKIIKKDVDFNRTSHIKIQQTYHGYPVWGANAILHIPYSKDNATKLANPLLSAPPSTKMNGSIYQDLDQDLSAAPPFIFNQQQMDKARAYVLNHFLNLGKTDKIVTTDQKLLVYIDHGKAHWAFKFNFALRRPHSLLERPTFIVDALTFVKFKQWDEMQFLMTENKNNGSQNNQTSQDDLDEVKGGGLGGNLKGINVYDGLRGNKESFYVSRDSKKHICYMRNYKVAIKKYKFDEHQWSYVGDVIQYKCDALDPKHGNIYWNGMFDATQSSGLSPANDAIYFAFFVSELYQGLYGVPVIKRETIEPNFDNDNKAQKTMININLHPDDEMWKMNAAYDPIANEVIIGDGDGEKFYPLASLDVIAHELSHGFTQRYAGFIREGQAAAINEAFSDMASQIAQYYANYHKNTWKIGAEVVVQKGKALRYMDNPKYDCVGVGRDPWMLPNCSIDNAEDYTDNMNPHHAAGVFNKAFYLLSNLPNWDITKAFNVMVQANMHHWLPNSDFTEAACGVIDAAVDYGYETAAIKKAFAVVGVKTNHC